MELSQYVNLYKRMYLELRCIHHLSSWHSSKIIFKCINDYKLQTKVDYNLYKLIKCVKIHTSL